MAKIDVTDANFEAEVINSSVPVLVDFWAPWCGPCLVLSPIVEELAKELEGKAIKIAAMNVDESPSTASKYQILSIPTLLVFKGGIPVDQMVGIQSKDVLKKKLEGYIA